MRTSYFVFLCAGLGGGLCACNSVGPATYLPPPSNGDSGSPTDAGCLDGSRCGSKPKCDGGGDACGVLTVPPMSVSAGDPCTLTNDCKLGYYCGADGTCDLAGTTSVGDTCATSANCVRGAVCYRATSGLYGVCALPVGATLSASQDGEDGGDGATGGTGTAAGVDGACTTLLDCEAGLACSATTHTCLPGVPGSGLPLPWTGETCNDALPADAGVSGVRAYFEVPAADGTPPHDFFRLPYPNDIRRSPVTSKINLTGFPHPGTAILGFDIVEAYVQASETDLDGFGTNQQIYFRFSASIVLQSLTVGAGGTVQMYDLTAGAPTSSISLAAGTAGDHYLCPNNLKVTTGPMIGGHTYAVTLSAGIQDSNGKSVQRDSQFGSVIGATAPSDPVLAAAFAAYAPLRTFLTAQNIDPATIIDASVFTTQHATSEMPLLRTAVLAGSAPVATGFVLCNAGVVSPCDDGLTGAAHVRGCIGSPNPLFDEMQGQITFPIMQQGTRPYTTAGTGAIAVDGAGTPIIQGTEPVCISITTPHGVTPPVGGWPVIIYAHGTGGEYRSGIEEGLAAAATSIALTGGTTARFAFLGYDGVMTGPRRGAGVTQSPDTLFFNFANPEAARDNVLQGSADIFNLVNAMKTVTLPGLPAMGTTTTFDPVQIYFMGHSQGSTVGVPAAPFEPNLAGMVFSGAGGDLRQALVTKENPVDLATLTPYILEDAPVDASHPALNLFQAFIERADAINYGGYLLQGLPTGIHARPLVQTYGIGDTYTPAPTLQAVANTIGLHAAGVVPTPPGGMPWPSTTGLTLPVTNNVMTSSGSVTAAILEADPMGAYDGHFVLFDNPALETQVMQFLGTASTGIATIQ